MACQQKFNSSSDQPPEKKQKIDESFRQPSEKAQAEENVVDETTEGNKDQGTSTILYRRRLPLELECEMFAFLNLPNQVKLISKMGKGIFGICGPKLFKQLRWRNDNEYPRLNGYHCTRYDVVFSPDGCTASIYPNPLQQFPSTKSLYAKVPFQIRQPQNVTSPLVFYYEVKILMLAHISNSTSASINIGMATHHEFCYSDYENEEIPKFHLRFGLGSDSYFWKEAGQELINTRAYGEGDVVGCGCLVMPCNEDDNDDQQQQSTSSNNNTTTKKLQFRKFFTLNGQIYEKEKCIAPVTIPSKTIIIDFFPCVTVSTIAEVHGNFGKQQFLFDPAEYLDNCRRQLK